MSRILTVRNLYDKKHKCLQIDEPWSMVFGEKPEASGMWLIYGREKNGKTTFALQLTNYLSHKNRVLYVSAEEGTSDYFVNTCKRIGIAKNNKKINVSEYLTKEELFAKIKGKRAANIVFIDNCTRYIKEMNKQYLDLLKDKFPEKLFIFIAHEKRNEPYGALAEYVAKYANIICHVKGLAVLVGGRCPGGILTIDEQKAKIFYGNDVDVN